MKAAAKALARLVFAVLVLPLAVVAVFGRFAAGFTFSAHAAALAPGLVGDYLRAAFYSLTLARCPAEVRISFGSFFSDSSACIGAKTYIGAYCVIGRAIIGERTQIASHVQILSGRRQHPRDEEGRILGSAEGVFEQVRIGSDCWIGAGAIVMADVGDRSTVGAGAVVTREVPENVVVVGNPAKVLGAQPD